MMTNIPELKLGLVSVSRDCFPMALSVGRRDALAAAYAKYGMLHNCPVCIESETDVAPALADLKAAGVNALVIFLGNFGPETAETTLAKQFDGPAMFCAAAEESGDSLLDGRGDAGAGADVFSGSSSASSGWDSAPAAGGAADLDDDIPF